MGDPTLPRYGTDLVQVKSNLFKFWFELTNNLSLFRGRKFVSFPRYDRRYFKILSWRRRLRAPFESRQVPRIRFSMLAVTHGPHEVDCRYQHSESENRCACS